MFKFMSSAIAVGAVCLAGAAHAAEPYALRPYFEIGPKFIFSDDDRMTDDGTGFHFGAGVPLHRYFGLELNLHHSWFDADGSVGSVDWKERGLETNALFTYPLSHGWVPYASIGIGLAESDLDNVGDTLDTTYSYGAGIFKYFNTLGARLDVKYRELDFNDSLGGSGVAGGAGQRLEDLVVRLGLVIPFGDALEYGPKAAPVAAVVDSDGDGVPDTADLCPDTPAGTEVDAKGCPKAQEIGDAEPAAALLDETVYFEFDKSDLTAAARAKLDAIAAAIAEAGDAVLSIKLAGHTDEIGTDAYNQALSERRAGSVRDYLSRKGIAADLLSLTAYGETRPAASNDTEAGRAQNRRVNVEATKR